MIASMQSAVRCTVPVPADALEICAVQQQIKCLSICTLLLSPPSSTPLSRSRQPNHQGRYGFVYSLERIYSACSPKRTAALVGPFAWLQQWLPTEAVQFTSLLMTKHSLTTPSCCPSACCGVWLSSLIPQFDCVLSVLQFVGGVAVVMMAVMLLACCSWRWGVLPATTFATRTAETAVGRLDRRLPHING